MQPVSVVQAQGLNAVFECLYPGAIFHIWGFNGEFPVANSYPPNVTSTRPSGVIPATLTIPATAQYNNTVVQCRVIVEIGDGFVGKLSENSTFQVQGRLAFLTVHDML